MSATFEGTVKWFNQTQGFGFIERVGGPDVSPHYNAISGGGIKKLAEAKKLSLMSRLAQRHLKNRVSRFYKRRVSLGEFSLQLPNYHNV